MISPNYHVCVWGGVCCCLGFVVWVFFNFCYILEGNLPGDLYFRLEKEQILIDSGRVRLELRRKKKGRYKFSREKYLDFTSGRHILKFFFPDEGIFI